MLPQPIHYHPDLTHERLSIVAELLLDEHYKTLDDLSSETDDNYTRGCTMFGRQKNRIKSVALAKTYPWLQVSNSANDLVFTIGSVPCRFSSDDPNSPKKKAALTVNRYQASFFDEIEGNEKPCRYCFIIDQGINEDADPSVVFLGFDATGVVRCQWESCAIRTFQSINTVVVPEAVEIGKPAVKPKKSTAASEGEANRL
jgi:hypothetical protein